MNNNKDVGACHSDQINRKIRCSLKAAARADAYGDSYGAQRRSESAYPQTSLSRFCRLRHSLRLSRTSYVYRDSPHISA